jgi:hypothetical protein
MYEAKWDDVTVCLALHSHPGYNRAKWARFRFVDACRSCAAVKYDRVVYYHCLQGETREGIVEELSSWESAHDPRCAGERRTLRKTFSVSVSLLVTCITKNGEKSII